jgi:hypothetical protein
LSVRKGKRFMSFYCKWFNFKSHVMKHMNTAAAESFLG